MNHLLALLFSVCAFVLLLVANLGTTFDSTFLPRVYFVSLGQSSTHQSVRYGLYSSCIYNDNTRVGCTQTVPGYHLDLGQIASINNDTLITDTEQALGDQVSSLLLMHRVGNILILPATVFIFLAMFAGLLIRKTGEDTTAPTLTIPVVGVGASLFAFLCSGTGIALIIYSHLTLFDKVTHLLEGSSYSWGPSIYLTGVACGLALASFVSYTVEYIGRKRQLEDLEEYDYYQPNKHFSDRQYY